MNEKQGTEGVDEIRAEIAHLEARAARLIADDVRRKVQDLAAFESSSPSDQAALAAAHPAVFESYMDAIRERGERALFARYDGVDR